MVLFYILYNLFFLYNVCRKIFLVECYFLFLFQVSLETIVKDSVDGLESIPDGVVGTETLNENLDDKLEVQCRECQ